MARERRNEKESQDQELSPAQRKLEERAAELSPTGHPKSVCEDRTLSDSFAVRGACSHHEGLDRRVVVTEFDQGEAEPSAP